MWASPSFGIQSIIFLQCSMILSSRYHTWRTASIILVFVVQSSFSNLALHKDHKVLNRINILGVSRPFQKANLFASFHLLWDMTGAEFCLEIGSPTAWNLSSSKDKHISHIMLSLGISFPVPTYEKQPKTGCFTVWMNELQSTFHTMSCFQEDRELNVYFRWWRGLSTPTYIFDT